MYFYTLKKIMIVLGDGFRLVGRYLGWHLSITCFVISALISIGALPYRTALGQTSCPEPERLITTTAAPPQSAKLWVAYRRMMAAASADADVVLLGDSITRGISPILQARLAPGRTIANLGLSADRTQHVIWRLGQPEAAAYHPKVVVLLIGTNNLSTLDTACGVLAGTTAILNQIDTLWQHPRILLLQIFPRGPGGTFRAEDRRFIADGLVALARDRPSMNVLDLGPDLSNEAGTYRPDLLHLLPHGYEFLTLSLARSIASLLP